jgi:ATP-binding cassette, subfamily B, bacterial
MTGRRKRSRSRWLWPLVRPHTARAVVAVLAVLAQTAAGLAIPYLVKIGIDKGVVGHRTDVLDAAAASYTVLVVVRCAASWVETRTVAGMGQRVLYAVRTKLFVHLQRLSVDFYEHDRTGRVVARMTSDIDAMGVLLTDGLVTLITNLVTLAGISVILVLLDWRLALATLAVTPLLAGAVLCFRYQSSRAWRRVREAATVVTTQLQEALNAVRTIQAFRREHDTAARFAAANDEERAAKQRTVVLAAMFFPGVELIGSVATVVVVVVGGPRVLAGSLAIGTFAAFLLYLRTLLGPLFKLSDLYDTFQSAVAGAERVGAALAVPPGVREATDPTPLRHPAGALRLDAVRFGYPGAGGEPGRHILRGIDLDLPAGATLALVGATGAGKSTIAKLAVRFYDPQAGRVCVDNVDLRDVAPADLRRAVAYVPQEGFLFSGTVAENIRYGRPSATPGEVTAAAQAVGAWPLVTRLPLGLETDVGERGVRLASGERQLVAIARAWLAEPAVLVLDEATSHLDAALEAQVRSALRRRGGTTVLVAHRLSTILDADRIAVVDGGRVVEYGTAADLLRAGGRFASLYHRWLDGHATAG